MSNFGVLLVRISLVGSLIMYFFLLSLVVLSIHMKHNVLDNFVYRGFYNILVEFCRLISNLWLKFPSLVCKQCCAL